MGQGSRGSGLVAAGLGWGVALGVALGTLLIAPAVNGTLDQGPFSRGATGAGEAGGGFFVGQESKVYFVTGDRPDDLRLSEKYPAGMVEGTLQMVPGAKLPFEQPPTEPVPVWLATNGVVCVGLPSGEVAPLSEGRYVAAVGKTGAGAFLQRDGESRYIATTEAPDENVFAARDEVTYEVVRNGIVLPQT